MKHKIISTTLFIFTLLVVTPNQAQEKKKYKINTIAFYNVENLFDTINDPNKNDEASPIMELKSNKSKVYWDKIEKISSTIAKIGFEKTRTSPAIIGVSEVENLNVLKDLVTKNATIKKR